MLGKMNLVPGPNTDAFDRTEPAALINKVPTTFAAAMIKAHQASPELFGLDERALFQRLRQNNLTPSPTDNQVRLAFWMEVNRAFAEGTDVEPVRVYGGICSKQFFYAHYLTAPNRVAWLLTPVVEYETKMREALDFSLDRLRSYLEIDANPGGRPNVKLMELQAKIFAMIDMRLKGGHTQRTENKNLSIAVSTSDKQVAQAVSNMSMDALEKRLKELDRRERAVQGQLPQGVVVERDPHGDSD